MDVEFIRFPTFERQSAKLFTENDILELEVALALNPADRRGACFAAGCSQTS